MSNIWTTTTSIAGTRSWTDGPPSTAPVSQSVRQWLWMGIVGDMILIRITEMQCVNGRGFGQRWSIYIFSVTVGVLPLIWNSSICITTRHSILFAVIRNMISGSPKLLSFIHEYYYRLRMSTGHCVSLGQTSGHTDRITISSSSSSCITIIIIIEWVNA